MENKIDSTSDNTRAEMNVQCETVHFSSDPPPPYIAHSADPVLTIQPAVIINPPLKTTPTYYNCNICNERVLTKIERVSTRKTHMIAGFICGFTLWCMLCPLGAIPYLLPTFKNTKHYCPNCNTLLGVYSKI